MNRASRQHLKSVRILAASIMYVYVCAFVGKGGTVLRFDGFCSGHVIMTGGTVLRFDGLCSGQRHQVSVGATVENQGQTTWTTGRHCGDE